MLFQEREIRWLPEPPFFNMKIRSYRDLLVWQKAIILTGEVYRLTEPFPQSEQYVLVPQMRRSAISIASNIAEGSRRGTRKDFRQFLRNAFGSGAELETQLVIVGQQRYSQPSELQKISDLLNEVMRMLNRLVQRLGN